MPACLGLLIGKSDTLVTHYRSHGYFLAKGGGLDAMVAEFYGRTSGSNRGLAGSMELGSYENHFHSGAIVGAPLPLASGSAFAAKFKGDGSIAVAVFGDGAMDAGVCYEALNIISLFKLPILMICENNGYAAHTRFQDHVRSSNMAVRANAFGIRALQIDGNDPHRAYSTLKECISSVREGGGPVFLEAHTYRTCGHVGPESDDWLEYRSLEEVERSKFNDPVTFMRKCVLGAGVSEAEIASVEDESRRVFTERSSGPRPRRLSRSPIS